MTTNSSYLPSIRKQFEYCKSLGDKTFTQLTDNDFFWTYNEESNSIAILVKHIAGNMLSRWTNFLTEDGEKEWRKRDQEFINTFTSKNEVLDYWEKGWNCLFNTLDILTTNHLDQVVYIRNHGHTVIEAINRQLSHYPYHIGQIVFLGKMITNTKWNSLSIPKGNSIDYNRQKFAKEKTRRHFTDDL